ncbi:MAG: hypothetical protein A2Z14_11645 [Chloroflexi bacterium RBG_16_48_8]|nr:MAG: hypothetical protein A2Z14_11645 [Chloroflexi bacterium RBG_16_48_8]
MGGSFTSGSDYQTGVAIFDLTSKTAQVLHAYTPLGGSTVEHYLSWSPDGNWLAFVTYAERPELGRQPALYVTQVDGQEEYYLGVGFDPVWSPDGKRLVYNEAKETPSSIWDHVVNSVSVGNWEDLTVMPIDAEIKNWIEG